MSAEALGWWWTFGSGAALGSFVTALACGRLWRASRLLDRLLGTEPERPPEPSVRPNPAIRIVREERSS